MRQEKGQGLAEFGLLLPVFLLAVMMIVDIGRAVYYYSVIYNAAREGARYGIIDQSSTNVAAAVKSLGSGFLDSPDSIISSQVVDVVRADGKKYKAIEVRVAYTFRAATPFLGQLTGSATNSILLSSRATMKLEQ